MVRQARRLVADGALGDAARGAGRVSAGLADRAGWRPPARSRPAGAPTRNARAPAARIGDIGTHAYNLADFVTGLKLESLSAELDRS